MTPLTPERIERAARAKHDLMGPYLGTPEQIAKHGDRVAARQLETAEKYATVALTAALSCPDGFRLVPVEPTAEMVRCGEDALRKSGSGLSQLDGRKAADRIYRAMLAASPAPAVDNAGWRPIETAPKEGTEILLFTSHMRDDFCDAFDAVQIGYWDKGNIGPGVHPVFHREPGWHLQKIGIPTHWQPLPSAPSQDAPPPRSLSNKD